MECIRDDIIAMKLAHTVADPLDQITSSAEEVRSFTHCRTLIADIALTYP